MSPRLLALPALLIALSLPLSAWAQSGGIEATLTVNGRDPDTARDRTSAIRVSSPAIDLEWKIRNRDDRPVTLSQARIEFSPYLPPRDIAIGAQLPPRLSLKNAQRIELPAWAPQLGAATPIRLTVFAASGQPVLQRDFWIVLGSPSFFENILGGGVAALAAAALALGAGALARAAGTRHAEGADWQESSFKPAGRILRYLAGGAAGLALGAWIVSVGITPPGSEFLTPTYALCLLASVAGAAYKILLSLVSKLLVPAEAPDGAA